MSPPLETLGRGLTRIVSKRATSAERRRAPFLLYLAALAALISSIAYFGWVRTWSSLNVPTLYPAFADMRVVQGAVISAQNGLNPWVSNPGDPWGRKINYPKLWVSIASALSFADESRFILICSMLVACFAAICAALLFCFPSFGLLAVLLSLATLRGIERGNSDLLIFCILMPAALWLPKLRSVTAILAATVLKLYPVFALAALVIQRQFAILTASMAGAVAVLIYLWDDLGPIRTNTPVSCARSYGFPSLFVCFGNALPFWVPAATYAAMGIGTFMLAYHFSRPGVLTRRPGAPDNLMLSGASIYVGTFLFSANFDYRLIFLIFCIPFLQTNPFAFARAFIIVILLAMNETLTNSFGWLVITWSCKIAIFLVLGAYLTALAVASLRPGGEGSNAFVPPR
jgi:hypothetical protein